MVSCKVGWLIDDDGKGFCCVCSINLASELVICGGRVAWLDEIEFVQAGRAQK